MAAFPGGNRSVLPLDNTKILNFWSGWEVELGRRCGSRGGQGRGWNGIGMGWRAGNARGARPCSWHCFGLCSAPPWPRLLLSSDGCRGIGAVPIPGPLSRRGAPVWGGEADEGLISAPQTLHSPSAGQCCDPTAAAVPMGSWEGWGSGHLPPRLPFFFLHWINGNQIVQPGESLEAKSCCWSPSRSVELLACVCLGGK